MTFEEIFAAEGLYKSDSFRKGTAFKIKQNTLGDQKNLELVMVIYDVVGDISPSEYPVVVSTNLFKKEYTKVFNIGELFK